MRAIHVGTTALVLSLTALLGACASDVGRLGAPGAANPFGPPPPPRPALFISPFGEAFLGETGQPWPSSDWFTGADDNLDGAVTFEEFEADGRRFFATLDANGDGRLNQDELAAYEQSLRGFSMGGGRPGGPRGPHGGGMARLSGVDTTGPDTTTLGLAPQNGGSRRPASRGRLQGYGVIAEAGFFNLPQPVKSADVNIDQRVTGEEWAAATQRWFYSLDTDRDGKLTLATLPRTPLQVQAERR